MKRLLILATTAVLFACGSAKVTSSSYSSVADKATQTERDQYIFQMKKKAGDYFEVVEVKLLNEEKGIEESVPFQVTEPDGNKSVLDIKGRSEFAVVAAKPKKGESVLATSAMIVYKAEENGPNKYYKVKKIGE